MGISEKKLFVLHVEDSGSDGHIIEAELKRVGHKVYYKRVSSRGSFFKALREERWNLIISDYFINGLSAIEALEAARDLNPDLAFILVSGRIGEESVADLMKAGVEDVVMKSRIERLVPVVRRILREHEIKIKEERARLIAGQAFAAKEQMLAIVSHDIKNPLSAIQLDAQMLLKLAEGESALSVEEVKLQARRILKTTDRLKVLISDLLDKNKKDDGLASLTRTQNDPLKLVQEVLDSCRPLLIQKEIRISAPEKNPSYLFSFDRNKMFQVLSNLLSNAIKFTPTGGEISISLEEKKRDFVFTVTDSGPGLNQTSLNKVFEKYWTGGTGTGLGLFICKTIVEAHGGQITALNNEKGGASFVCSLPKPLAKIENKTIDLSDRHDIPSKIVVIDDDEDLREVITWALAKEGFSVKSFSHPLEALSSLKEGRFIPGLIIVDYHMDGMKGGEFLKQKVAISDEKIQHCPVLMISATPEEVQRDVSRDLYRDIITKPIDLEGLVTKIKSFTT